MPRQVDHEQRRQLIAAALLEVTAADGLEGVSLRHVAARAGVTAGMVQHYFPSKDAMLSFAMGAASDRYEARLTGALHALGGTPAPRAVVAAVLTALVPVDAQQAQDARVGLAFRSYAATRRRAADRLATGDAQLRDLVAGQLREAGVAEDPARSATALLALAEGLGVQVVSSSLAVDDALAALHGHLDLVLGTPAATGRATRRT